jgi:thiamine pyrophosphate-dependent acetolactate synthase large subunit-like protein
MPKDSFRAGVNANIKLVGALDRRKAVPNLVGDPKDFLIISALGGAARDTAQICEPHQNFYAFAGVMGGATMTGLGLALAQPKRHVLVITGDGDLLMNIGSLATVAVMNPPNFSILCVDNGHYWETGRQRTHTALGTDLAAMAAGAGIKNIRTVVRQADIPEAASLLRQGAGVSFVLLKVKPGDPPKIRRSHDAAYTKFRFRQELLGD